ncbi:pyridoxal phosphate-dependent decarboxylase family protein [Cumulibacter manganitolerans]|uniref:pyridoxal phosphate-dependent decarboxylase family protein n=1 Tax=Cumulibacter manganitolerans TaxID=1884992 RepID=UPI001E3748C9|nr:pyridoxal-dependent decarboxylase [Cumulibacter manganitolerans]
MPEDVPPLPHLTPEEFRRHGHAVIDWIADYWTTVGERPVLSQAAPGSIARALPPSAPEVGEPFTALLADLDRVVLPGITHWQHPRFFGYFPANSSPAAVLGDLVSSGIGAQGMLWSTSPALTEIEQVVTDWLADAMGLGDWSRSTGPGGGVIQDTASTATMTALLAALHRATGGTARDTGLQDGRRYAVYASTEAHSSLLKAAMMTGVGYANVRQIAVDPGTQAMRPEELRAAVEADVAAGVVPVMVVSAVGTTATCAVDPTRAIGEIAAQHGIWLHVDAAFAGVAAICPEHRDLLDGVDEYADSLVTNPHKWLLTTFDCSVFWVRDRAALTGALSIVPEYLRNTASDSGAVVDYRDWHPQLGRRFRAMKLWAVLRTYGLDGVRAHLRSGIAMARRLEELVTADPRFELALPRSLSLVCFALRDGDRTAGLMEAVNASGIAYLTHTRLGGRFVIRASIGGVWTTPEDIELTWRALQRAADGLA